MRKLFIIGLACLLSTSLWAQGGIDFRHPDYLSFETGRHSSASHAKTGKRSYQWSWRRNGATLDIKHPVPYLPQNPNPEDTSVSSFVFWVYSPEPLDGSLEFEFLKQGRVCCHFPYKLGFTGWRGAWVAFDRDMEGRPEEGMDQIRIRANGISRGTLYFDGIIPAAFEDVRYHTADRQAPFINRDTDVHWLQLLRHGERQLDIRTKETLSSEDRAEMALIRKRFLELVAGNTRGYTLAQACELLPLTDKSIFFTRYAETYYSLGIRDAARRWKQEGQLLKDYNDHLFKLALGWMQNNNPEEKSRMADIYLQLTRHLLDEGFAAGSAQGTLHHLGYSMRNFYTAPVIMQEVLKEAGLLEPVQQAMEWFSGAGEVKTAPEAPGMDIDAFNTYLLSRVAAFLVLEDTPYKFACLQALSRWIDNGFKYTGGTKACFKTDGTVFHHRKGYPAYAVGGFDGAVKAVWLLSGTSFAISCESHGILKNALLEMRFYCNQASFPLAMSGRHPDGDGALIPLQYAILADAGSPDGAQPIDPDLAGVYLRLSQGENRYARKFTAAGFTAEPAPTGVRNYGYNCSLSVRQDNWLVTLAGHSRYLWAAEIYPGANHYGRYLTHGSMEILCGGDPVSSHGSGYQVAGYDWCHIPGTTAGELPLPQMKAHVVNPDAYSGYEEMLLSDEWFAGGLAAGDQGVFAMKLHEHDKYNGSLRATKSWFVSGNRILCLGSDIQSRIPAHTTLFQNAVEAQAAADSTAGESLLRDRFGNAWLVTEGESIHTRRLQHSLHEESDAPTEGWFEKAYIRHDASTPAYEYLVLVKPKEDELKVSLEKRPYEVLARNAALHAVRWQGCTAAAVFEEGPVDETIVQCSPCLLLYSKEGGDITLNLSQPDLALYEGPADEMYDREGKRIERSVYSRQWVDHDCGTVVVRLILEGVYHIVQAPEGTECTTDGRRTCLTVYTSEARTEKLLLHE